MKNKKKIAILGLLFTLLLGGCSKMSKDEIQSQPTREEVKQEILDHLEEKYGIEFECQSIEYRSWAQGGHENMFAYPKGGHENNTFSVNRYPDKKGGARYEDGYVGYVMEPIYQEKIELAVKKHFPESIALSGFMNRYIYPDAFTTNMDFDVFDQYKNKKNYIGVGIHIVSENESNVSKESIKLLKKELMNISHVGGFTIVGYTPEDYQTYIVEEYARVVAEYDSFKGNITKFAISEDWGQIDFDYEYTEEN